MLPDLPIDLWHDIGLARVSCARRLARIHRNYDVRDIAARILQRTWRSTLMEVQHDNAVQNIRLPRWERYCRGDESEHVWFGPSMRSVHFGFSDLERGPMDCDGSFSFIAFSTPQPIRDMSWCLDLTLSGAAAGTTHLNGGSNLIVGLFPVVGALAGLSKGLASNQFDLDEQLIRETLVNLVLDGHAFHWRAPTIQDGLWNGSDRQRTCNLEFHGFAPNVAGSTDLVTCSFYASYDDDRRWAAHHSIPAPLDATHFQLVIWGDCATVSARFRSERRGRCARARLPRSVIRRPTDISNEPNRTSM